MSKLVYCANCGTRLQIMRKALPKYARIIDLVEYHECPDEPVPFDLTPEEVPVFAPEIKGEKAKFVQKLNDLSPQSIIGAMSSVDMRDRRNAADLRSEISSTAPKGLIKNLLNLPNSSPTHDLEEPDE